MDVAKFQVNDCRSAGFFPEDLISPFHQPMFVEWLADHLAGRAEILEYTNGGYRFIYPIVVREIAGGAGRRDVVSSWYYGEMRSVAVSAPPPSVWRMARKEIEGYFREAGVVTEFVRLGPHPDGEAWASALAGVEVACWETFRIDLSSGIDPVRAGYSESYRKKIVRARRRGCVVRLGGSADDLKRWSVVYEAEMIRKKAPPHLRFTFDEFADLKRRMNSRFVFIVAEHDSTLVGGMILLVGECTAFDFLMAVRADSWNTGVNSLLMDVANEWGVRRGLRRRDLLGGRPGVRFFKNRFAGGGGLFRAVGVVHDGKACEALSQAREPRTDFFPSYRSRGDS